MNKIEAKISPDKIAQVTAALAGIGIKGMTITNVKNLDTKQGLSGIYRGRAYSLEVTAELALELVVTDARTEGSATGVADTAQNLHLTVSALEKCGSENGIVGVFRGQPCHFKGGAKRQIQMDMEVS
jgi:nitrogen regulatory protein PII